MLEIKGITKIFGDAEAVKRVDLTIQDGEFFSLLGPSGCGKTTLLRMIGGFEIPTDGQILLDGQRIDQLPPHHRQTNMVFQRYALFPHLSVWDNVAFGPRVKKISAEETKDRVEESLALVKMESFAKRSVTTLSGGQQQRIALARALVNRPKVLLLDEPLSALDLKLRQQMQTELLALQRRLKITFIFVTHDQDEALSLSDRIAVMNGGVVEQVGSPQEIYEYPKTSFVGSFIGSMNSFVGSVSEIQEAKLMVTLGAKRPLSLKPSKDGLRPLPRVELGQRVRLMVRPEKLRLLKSQPGVEQNYLEGLVKEVLYAGPTTEFIVQPKNSEMAPFLVIQPNSAVSTTKTLHAGDQIVMAWSPEDCILMEET